MINTWAANEQTLNSLGSTASIDWELTAPQERQRVFVLDIGSLRIPISSAQATMRLSGQSYLQVIVPGGDKYADDLESLTDQPMLLRSGYRFEDQTLSPLEVIATAPFQLLRRDEGRGSDTLTLEGYGYLPESGSNSRALKGVRYRSTAASGRRRSRCDIDLFLKPGYTAVDSDGIEFPVGVIQYFINARSDFMEVIQDG